MSFDKAIVEYVSAECDAEGCDKVLIPTKIIGHINLKKAYCPEYSSSIISIIEDLEAGD